MTNRFSGAATAAIALLLAGCGGGAEKGEAEGVLEKGQVVATVEGKDVTIHELNAELVGVQLPAGAQRKQVEQAALQSLVNRTILADIARERGIDDSPNFVLQRRRSEEALLVQLLQRDIASKVRPPSRDEANRFIAANPDLFAQRKIYSIDQIQFQTPDDVAKLKAFEPLKTMEAVEQRLIEDGIQYRRAPTKLDTVGTQPDVIRQIAKLPEGEIFIIPQGRTMVANRITGVEVQPFTDDKAVAYAMNLIQSRKVGEAAEKALKERIEKARAAVKYQPGYAPPAAPKGVPAAPKPAAT